MIFESVKPKHFRVDSEKSFVDRIAVAFLSSCFEKSTMETEFIFSWIYLTKGLENYAFFYRFQGLTPLRTFMYFKNSKSLRKSPGGLSINISKENF